MQKLSISFLSFLSLCTLHFSAYATTTRAILLWPEELYCESSTTRQSLCQSKGCKM
ncbi:hypothetical protein BDZ91DRAFT_750174 [Kalaharituber pfeilii]|nr:hypothetical protein BDZ91DRAFT_750174 [Kalaharituber pfeilii]